jgi:hypothetical protein
MPASSCANTAIETRHAKPQRDQELSLQCLNLANLEKTVRNVEEKPRAHRNYHSETQSTRTERRHPLQLDPAPKTCRATWKGSLTEPKERERKSEKIWEMICKRRQRRGETDHEPRGVGGATRDGDYCCALRRRWMRARGQRCLQRNMEELRNEGKAGWWTKTRSRLISLSSITYMLLFPAGREAHSRHFNSSNFNCGKKNNWAELHSWHCKVHIIF